MQTANPFQTILDKQATRSSSNNKGARSLAISVTRYETNTNPPSVVGYELEANGKPDTSHEVRVSMRPDDKAATRKYVRPEIETLNNPNEKVHTQPGGILIFNQVWDGNQPNTYTAGWVNAVSHYPGESTVRKVMASTAINNEKQSFKVFYLKPEEAVKVNSLAELESTLTQTLNPKVPDMHMLGAVRLTDPVSGSAVCVNVNSTWEKNDNSQWSHAADGKTSLDAFKAQNDTNKVSWNDIANVFNSGMDMQCEVIPGAMIYMGKSSTREILNKQARREGIMKTYRHDNKVVFTESYIAARAHPEGTPYITSIERTSSRSPRYEMAHIPTQFYTPSEENVVDGVKAEQAMGVDTPAQQQQPAQEQQPVQQQQPVQDDVPSLNGADESIQITDEDMNTLMNVI